jgi:hypothetical protein
MVFERRTLPVATLSVDISFMSLWGGEASRAMVSLSGCSDRPDDFAPRGICRSLDAAKTGAGFAFFNAHRNRATAQARQNPGTVNQELGFTSNFK